MVPNRFESKNHNEDEAQQVTSLVSKGIGTRDFAESTEKTTPVTDEYESSDEDEGQTSASRGLLRPHFDARQSFSPQRRLSFVEEEETGPIPDNAIPANNTEKAAPVTWMSLPKKDQLAVLTLARLAEPLTERGLQAYLFYQLKSFDPNLSDATVSSQAGYLSASFAAAQFLTAVLWGRAADSPRFGRKKVLIVGLIGTLVSCIGIGFSKSFTQAIIFRALGGAVNGNVGVMRTMISEIIKEKKYQSRAFLLLPMCFNIGVIIGPIVGGFLADPIHNFPSVFGPDSSIGGKAGVGWMKEFPYALPNLFSMTIIFTALLGVIFGLDETHHILKRKKDWGRQLGKGIVRLFHGRLRSSYDRLDETDPRSDPNSIDLENRPDRPVETPTTPTFKPTKFRFSKIFTPNVLLTLLNNFALTLHISAFNALIFIFLPAPRAPVPPPQPHNLIRFTGGLGLPASQVGIATAIIGFIGFPMQIFLYPRLHTRFGTLKCFRLFLPFSLLAYIFIPYLTLVPQHIYMVWPLLAVVLCFQVISRTFVVPGAVILVNNCSPSPLVLGTIHGVAQSVSSGARTIGPLVGGWALGEGLQKNMVGAVWWSMAIVAVLNWMTSFTVFEGDGGMGTVEEVSRKTVAVRKMPQEEAEDDELERLTDDTEDRGRPRRS